MGGLFQKALTLFEQEQQNASAASESALHNGDGGRAAGGLFHKALILFERDRQGRVGAPADKSTNGGISTEEREKIASRIDQIMSENRIAISPQMMEYTPKRSGALLPVITNISILALVAAAAIVISFFLNRQEQDIATGRTAVQGAENRLIEALKQDAARRLQERDQAILATQEKLKALGAEADKLKTQTDAIVRQRSDELQAVFQQRLDAERERLARAGLSASAEAARMNQYEAAQRAALEKQLDAVRRQAEADQAAREKALADQTAQYQKDLDAARQSRLSMQSEFDQKEAALRQQYAQSTAAAQGETARVKEEMSRMQAERQKEQLILDQIYAGYNQVNQALKASDYAAALASLDSIRAYFDKPDVIALPTIQKRKPVELFLVGSLDELIRSRRQSTAASAAAVAQSADLRAVSDLVARGDALSQTGDLAGARESYLAAIQKIPSVGHGYARLEQLKAPEQPAPQLIGGLRQANVFYQAGNFLGSVEQYRRAVNLVVKDDALAKQITDNVMNAGYHILAADDLAALARLRSQDQKRQAIVQRLRDIRTQYSAYTTLAPQFSVAGPQTDASLASLLQAKILIRQILDSEPVRSRYPDLGANAERYFQALEQQGKAEGRQAAINDVNGLLDRLMAGGGTVMVGASPSSGAKAEDPLVALLDRLETILAAK